MLVANQIHTHTHAALKLNESSQIELEQFKEQKITINL